MGVKNCQRMPLPKSINSSFVCSASKNLAALHIAATLFTPQLSLLFRLQIVNCITFPGAAPLRIRQPSNSYAAYFLHTPSPTPAVESENVGGCENAAGKLCERFRSRPGCTRTHSPATVDSGGNAKITFLVGSKGVGVKR